MIKNTSFQIENKLFYGKLIYGNGNENENEIKCSLMKLDSEILQNKFESEEGVIFTLNGTIENKKFTGMM